MDLTLRDGIGIDIEYFTAEVLAENRTMLGLLPGLGQVQAESHGPVVTARVKLAEPPASPSRTSLTC